MPYPICRGGLPLGRRAGVQQLSFVPLLVASIATWLVLLVPAAGCRSLRSRKVSEVDMAAARQLSLQGIDAQQRGQWERAEMLFAAAIVKCPSDERARSGYAEALWRRGERAAAISTMEEAVRLSANDPERIIRLGGMYLAQGDIARAKEQAQRAIAANAQLAGAWALRGSVLQAEGNLGDALASYHRALALEPSLPDVQLAVADIYLRQNRPQRALATLQSLADRFPSGDVPPDVIQRQALAMRSLHRPEAPTRGPVIQASAP
jgi:tetratricopeptide (TPR) repeat protein